MAAIRRTRRAGWSGTMCELVIVNLPFDCTSITLRPAPCASGCAPCFPNRIPIRAAGLAAPSPLQFFSPVFSQPLGAIPVSGPADFYVSGTACQPPAVAAVQGSRRHGRRHHPFLLLQPGFVLPLPRRRPQAGAGGFRGAGHHADHQRHPADALFFWMPAARRFRAGSGCACKATATTAPRSKPSDWTW
jgi:hypothetical protein